MMDRKALKQGMEVWRAELAAGRVTVERVTIRRTPRGRQGPIVVDGGTRSWVREYDIYPSQSDALTAMRQNARDALDAAQSDMDAAEAAWIAFITGPRAEVSRHGG